ncbi:hypothetical protein ABTX79_36630, partial [Streptomyces sp. NPDC096153]
MTVVSDEGPPLFVYAGEAGCDAGFPAAADRPAGAPRSLPGRPGDRRAGAGPVVPGTAGPAGGSARSRLSRRTGPALDGASAAV